MNKLITYPYSIGGFPKENSGIWFYLKIFENVQC